MPRKDDYSRGDARRPYADQGGAAGHHAHSHDVRREEATRPKGPGPEGDDFEADLHGGQAAGSHLEDSVLAKDEDKAIRRELPGLDADELKRLLVLTVGTRLEQGAVYLDLNDLAGGPFKARGDQAAAEQHRYVAKRDTDYELWGRLVDGEALIS